jgi:glycosyltransferase involved in cell wall biosynthesis
MDSIAWGLLDAGHNVRVLSIATPKHPDRRSELSPAYLQATSFETVFVDTRVRLIPAAFNLFGEASYNVTRFDSARFRDKLIAVLRSDAFDIVQLESLYMMPYLADVRRNTKAKVIYRAHNIEHQVWDRMAAGARGLKQNYMRVLARRLEAYERAHVNSADGVAAITGEDAAQLRRMGCTRPIIHLPYLLPLEGIQPEAPNNVFFHMGAMDWKPNMEAVRFLVERIWPLIRRQRPAAVLRLGGRNMPRNYMSGDGIRVDGEVADAKAYMRESGILLTPLLSGGGMRVKLVEAMAMGRAVVSTSLGVEGIPVENGIHAAVADTAEAFAAAAIRMHDDEVWRIKIGRAAQQLVMENFDRRSATGKLIEFYRQVQGSDAHDDALRLLGDSRRA